MMNQPEMWRILQKCCQKCASALGLWCGAERDSSTLISHKGSGSSPFSWYHGPELPSSTEGNLSVFLPVQQSVKMQVGPLKVILRFRFSELHCFPGGVWIRHSCLPLEKKSPWLDVS